MWPFKGSRQVSNLGRRGVKLQLYKACYPLALSLSLIPVTGQGFLPPPRPHGKLGLLGRKHSVPGPWATSAFTPLSLNWW